ncbi:MAG: hypothetical protein BWY21_02093 [Parcubacteria group bacterium ADurb.Bin216]|nr:MAG: hypothetical protein BWY21_02093 [Parcubacteria group bacterium ADurb.Bin216]
MVEQAAVNRKVVGSSPTAGVSSFMEDSNRSEVPPLNLPLPKDIPYSQIPPLKKVLFLSSPFYTIPYLQVPPFLKGLSLTHIFHSPHVSLSIRLLYPNQTTYPSHQYQPSRFPVRFSANKPSNPPYKIQHFLCS